MAYSAECVKKLENHVFEGFDVGLLHDLNAKMGRDRLEQEERRPRKDLNGNGQKIKLAEHLEHTCLDLRWHEGARLDREASINNVRAVVYAQHHGGIVRAVRSILAVRVALHDVDVDFPVPSSGFKLEAIERGHDLWR